MYKYYLINFEIECRHVTDKINMCVERYKKGRILLKKVREKHPNFFFHFFTFLTPYTVISRGEKCCIVALRLEAENSKFLDSWSCNCKFYINYV